MADPLFDPDTLYRRAQIKPKFSAIGDRTLDVVLAGIDRVKLGHKLVFFRGSDLNTLVAKATRQAS